MKYFLRSTWAPIVGGLMFGFFSVATFADECPRLDQGIRISSVGDVLLHQSLFRGALKEKDRFRVLWSKLPVNFNQADLLTGNLEGPVAPGVIAGGKDVPDVGAVYDGVVYSGDNFLFNYNPGLADDLVAGGFGLVTTANNHAMDRGSLGVDRTIEQLTRAHLPFVGTRVHDSTAPRDLILNIKSYRVGVIACAEMLNGFRDKYDQVLACSSPEVVQMITDLKQLTDAVLVFPHWGEEYMPNPNATQKNWARQWIRAGATAVIGNHPHVLQTVEWISRLDGSKGLVVYSLGNFVAGQAQMERRTSAIIHLDLVPSPTGLEIEQFSYLPTYRPPGSLSLIALTRESAELTHIRTQLGPAICR